MNNKKTQTLQKLKASKEALQKLLDKEAYKTHNEDVKYLMDLIEKTDQAIKQLELLIELDEKIILIEKEKQNNGTN